MSHPQRTSAAVPWAVRRMTHYVQTIQILACRVEIDPGTQIGVRRDRFGQIIEAGKHGTGTDTNSPTGTGTDGSDAGDNDSDSNPDGDQD